MSPKLGYKREKYGDRAISVMHTRVKRFECSCEEKTDQKIKMYKVKKSPEGITCVDM